MRNIVNDSTVWAKVRRLGLLVSLVFTMGTTALGQTNRTTNHPPPKDSVRHLLIDTTKYHELLYYKWPEKSDTSVIADTPFITKKEIVLYKDDDPVGKALIIAVILLQLASIWILLHYRARPKLGSSDNGERDAEIEGLKDKIKALDSDIDDWRSQTGYKTPKAAKEHIDELNSKCVKAQEAKKTREKELKEFQEMVKNDPESFMNNREYKKLSELIKKSQKCDDLSNDPSLIDSTTASGKLIAAGRLLEEYIDNPKNVTTGNYANTPLASVIRKGIFLDQAKDDLQVVIDDKAYIAGSILQNAVSCVEEPYKILSTNMNASGLYKLISDLNNIADAVSNSKDITSVTATSNEMKEKLKPVMDGLKRYQKFGAYQNYWSNIRKTLYNVLNDLHNHNDLYNMRALMFYCSQFYSIAETICNIHKGNTNSRAYDWNVALFNKTSVPGTGNYGIPDISDDELNDFKFSYTGAQDEDKRRNYFQRFDPMRFILISTYYN